MPTLSEIVAASLREEILLHSSQQFFIALYAITVATALSLVARWTRLGWPSVLQVVMLISATFAVARADLLMHRAGAYIEAMEAADSAVRVDGGGWERFKAAHAATKLVPLYDVLSALVFVVLFVEGQIRAWTVVPSRWRLTFLIGTCALQLAAFLAVPAAVLVSRSPS